MLDHDHCWQALCERDARCDGQFVFAVRSTGIYCRPSCAARRPRRDNVSFHTDAASAEAAGYRPCKRCSPQGQSPAEQLDALVVAACRLLESSEQPQQRALMAELAARLYPHWQGSPESYLTDFITRHAIAPFWQNDLPISRQELAVALEKSNSKNSWIDYAPAQRQRMIEEAFRDE